MVSIKEGDEVLFVDSSGKTYLKKIEIRTFHTHHGAINLSSLAGKQYGDTVETSKGHKFTMVKPDFRDIIGKKLKRGPQIINRIMEKKGTLLILNLVSARPMANNPMKLLPIRL